MYSNNLFNFTMSNKVNWIFFFILLTLFGLACTIQSSIVLIQKNHPEVAYFHNLCFNLFYWWFWLFAIPAIIWLAKKFNFRRGTVFTSSFAHTFSAISIIVIHQLYTSAWCNYIFGARLYLPIFKKLIWRILNLEWIFVDFVVYCLFVIGYFALEYQRKSSENEVKISQLETRLAQAQLQALKMQVHPHFLFNTMNAISTLILKGEIQKANNMLVLFSEFLRMTLEETGNQKVPLEKELLFIERYLEVEKIRFQDKLNVVYDIHPSTSQLMVPNLVLQPLVENAVKYAIAPKTSNGLISIKSEFTGKKLRIQIQDNGPGIKDVSKISSASGIGLKNTKERLSKLYGDEAIIRFENLSSGGLLITIDIPAADQSEPVVTSKSVTQNNISPAYQI